MTDRELLRKVATKLMDLIQESEAGYCSTQQVSEQQGLVDDIYMHLGRTSDN
jgi:predicted Zn-dependent peptidase